MAAECAVCHNSPPQLLRCARCRTRMYCDAACQKQDWTAHKVECKRQNYILQVDLFPRFIRNPRIRRTISCPASATFAQLHTVIQVTFGWACTHLYSFDVFNSTETMGREKRLDGPEPMFRITELSDEDDDFPEISPARDSSKITLHQVLDHPSTKGKTIHYKYDFGDGWEHILVRVGRADPTSNFICLDGEGHGCAEDVGGYSGWKELLEAFDARNPTREQKDHMDWYKTQASNRDPAGLSGEAKWRWDKDEINRILVELDVTSHQEMTTSSKVSSLTHSILLISLEKESYFEDMYAEVLAKLRTKASIVQATHIASALNHITNGPIYKAIILTDPAIMDPAFTAVQEAVVKYVRNGGTVIFGFHWSSFSQPQKVDSFFKNTWSLNWRCGDYHRCTHSLNKRAEARFSNGRYPNLRPYSMKALHLRNIRLKDQVYTSDESSKDQSAAVFADYGTSGHLGWLGDVNTELGTTELLIAMCDI